MNKKKKRFNLWIVKSIFYMRTLNFSMVCSSLSSNISHGAIFRPISPPSSKLSRNSTNRSMFPWTYPAKMRTLLTLFVLIESTTGGAQKFGFRKSGETCTAEFHLIIGNVLIRFRQRELHATEGGRGNLISAKDLLSKLFSPRRILKNATVVGLFLKFKMT